MSHPYFVIVTPIFYQCHTHILSLSYPYFITVIPIFYHCHTHILSMSHLYFFNVRPIFFNATLIFYQFFTVTKLMKIRKSSSGMMITMKIVIHHNMTELLGMTVRWVTKIVTVPASTVRRSTWVSHQSLMLMALLSRSQLTILPHLSNKHFI